VPVVLSTDDQGVLRTDMTNEYVRAAREQGLGYRDLKAISRAGWNSASARRACGGPPCGRAGGACAQGFDAPACRDLAKGSEKARLQLALEAQLAAFEDRGTGPGALTGCLNRSADCRSAPTASRRRGKWRRFPPA
jgi:adenosine deaminase